MFRSKVSLASGCVERPYERGKCDVKHRGYEAMGKEAYLAGPWRLS